jgi:8-oxo-dGTP diphosphatase
MSLNPPQTKLKTDAGLVVLTWIDCQDRAEMDKYQPCTQVYAVCFNQAGEILVIDEKGDGSWKIIGGTPEDSETPEQALSRELLEEADVELQEMLPVGVQRVEEFFSDPAYPRTFYQLRFAGTIARLHPQTPDPDSGRIYRRQFVPAEQINDIVRWGDTGRAMFAVAIKRVLG